MHPMTTFLRCDVIRKDTKEKQVKIEEATENVQIENRGEAEEEDKLPKKETTGMVWTRVNPFVLSYVYISTKSQNRCDSCTYIYVHGLCDRNMGLLPASKRHFTASPHEVFT